MLAVSVASLRDRAAAPPEILVAADDDDPVTIALARELGTELVVTPRLGYDRMHDYYNMLSLSASGDWQLVWNDDAVMLTERWDEIIESQPPEVYIADVQSPRSPMCSFPAVRREAVAVLGRFSTANPHVDTFWTIVGKETGTLRPVQVHIDCITSLRTNSHDFYSVAHLAEIAACAVKLRQELGLR